jgi:hypothetical protein
MNAKKLAVPAMVLGLAAGSAGLATAAQGAAAESTAKSRSTVTIQAQGLHLSGKVNSPKRVKCASGRKVHIVMQMGARGNDMQMGWVRANRNGSWSANPGHAGRYYAVVKPTLACKGDSSPTVRAQR